MRLPAECIQSLLAVLPALYLSMAAAVPTAGRTEITSVHAFTNPLNSTLAESVRSRHKSSTATGAAARPIIRLVNNVGDGAKAYITCQLLSWDWVYISPSDGSFHPPADGEIPDNDIAFELGALNEERALTLTGYVSSCRVYGSKDGLHLRAVKDGNNKMSFVQPAVMNPSDANYHKSFGISEFTYHETSCANPSHVDFADLGMGQHMILHDGVAEAVVGGLKPGAKANICAELKKVSTPQAPWDKGCLKSSDGIARVMAPNEVIGMGGGAFEGYFDDINHQVLEKYANTPLTVSGTKCKTDPAAKTITCGSSGPVPFQPSALEIFTCTGTFDKGEVWAMKQICAAYHRGHMLLEGGNLGPSLGRESYYQNDIHNVYSKAVHMYEHTGRGYAFSKDDISGKDEVAGLQCTPGDNLKELKVFIGGSVNH